MQSVIMHPDGVVAGVESDSARSEIPVTTEAIEEVIQRSQHRTSVERLGVYANAYYARLVECLESDFPALRHVLDEEAFGGFVVSYLQDYPSTSYTLADLSAHLADFLAETRPPRDDPDDETPDWVDFMIDLARLERTYVEVFDGPGEERIELLTADDLRSVPQDHWPDIRLRTVDSLRLLELKFPAHEYVTAVRKEENPQVPAAQRTLLAISRRDYIVRRQALSPVQFALLGALADGQPLGAAIESAVALTDATFEAMVSELQTWFRHWTAAGWFRAVELS